MEKGKEEWEKGGILARVLVPPDPEGDFVRGRGTVDGDELLVNDTGETTTPKTRQDVARDMVP